MSNLVIPNNYANVSFRFTLTGSSHQFGFSHGIQINGAVPHTPENIATDAFNAFQSGYGMANAYSVWTLQLVHVVSRVGGDLFSGDGGEVTAGTGGGGEVNTANCAMIVKKQTGRAGKQFRGRMYWPMLSLLDADVDNAGNIDSGVLAVIDANVQGFYTDWLATDTVTSLVLLHAEDSPPEDPNAVTSWVTESMIGTQRRRLR